MAERALLMLMDIIRHRVCTCPGVEKERWQIFLLRFLFCFVRSTYLILLAHFFVLHVPFTAFLRILLHLGARNGVPLYIYEFINKYNSLRLS